MKRLLRAWRCTTPPSPAKAGGQRWWQGGMAWGLFLGMGIGSAAAVASAGAGAGPTAGWLAGGALLAGGVAGVCAWRAAQRRCLAPWLQVLRTLQQRPVHDLQALQLPDHATPDVQALVTALNRRLAVVHAQNEAQQRFVADAAHQLRTPLAALQTQVEAWTLKVQSQDGGLLLQREQVEHLRLATRRTTQLAHQLLALSRVDTGLRQAAQPERVDLQNLCEQLLEASWEQAMAKGLDLGLEVCRVHVLGHAWLLRELVANVLDNALKYTPRGGQVTVRCGCRSAGAGVSAGGGTGDAANNTAGPIFVEVEDDGPGVPPAECAHLTRRFYRVPGTVGEGTGLGLAIAEEIAHGHGAQLEFARANAAGGLRVTLVFEPESWMEQPR